MITIGCSFGGLSSVKLATNSTATTTTDIPHLRFEHGDLAIKLDRDPSKWLVIHSKVFAVVSPVFAASASDSWKGTAQLDSIQHPDTGEIVEVRTLALKLVDDTYILEGKDVLLEFNNAPTTRAVPFHRSSLALEGWPDLTGGRSNLANDESDCTMASHDPSESARALHVFFALVYGAQLTIEEIAGEKHITPRLLDVCAYAEFWGCLDAIGPPIARAFPTDQHGTTRLLYKTVARSPKAYAVLAKKLHIEVLYHDALRHLVAQAYERDLDFGRQPSSQGQAGRDWAAIADIMELGEEEVLNILPWQLDWIKRPGGRRPHGKAKLEGKGWYEWVRPCAACFNINGKYTHLAVPKTKLTWENRESGDLGGTRKIRERP